MTIDNKTRWSVVVSKETDMAVRDLLARRGLKKGDLSKFIEDAVKWRVFDQTLADARAGFNDLTAEAGGALIAEACAAARLEILRILKDQRL